MALYAPFYAGKNAPVLQKRKPSKKVSAKPIKQTPSIKKTMKKPASCSEAAKQLIHCRGKLVRGTMKFRTCKQAGKTLSNCRWKK